VVYLRCIPLLIACFLVFSAWAGAPASGGEEYYFNPAGIVNNLELTERQEELMRFIMKEYADRMNGLIDEVQDACLDRRSERTRAAGGVRRRARLNEKNEVYLLIVKMKDLRHDTEKQVMNILYEDQLIEWRRLMDKKEEEMTNFIVGHGKIRYNIPEVKK